MGEIEELISGQFFSVMQACHASVGHPSVSHDNPAAGGSVNGSREEWFNNLLKAAADFQGHAQSVRPKIQKVPLFLPDIQNFKKYYEPRVVSIGPIHHGKPMLQQGEKYKKKLAATFIQDNYLSSKEIYRMIEMNIKELRQCFVEEATQNYNDEAFIRMMIVDGFAVLQYIHYHVIGKLSSKLKYDQVNFSSKLKNDQVDYMQQDLFLLENQLPFHFLEQLMELSGRSEECWHYISIFISLQPAPFVKRSDINKPIHLLDLLRTTLLHDIHRKQVASHKSFRCFPLHHNVQDLKNAGIWLKRTKTNSLRDISYISSRLTASLNLPRIAVDESTGQRFFNLLAFEMCPDFDNDFGITSYICFLNSLMNKPEHVRELREAGILDNFLGSDQKVAQIFNELGTYLVPNPNMYLDVRAGIEEHHRTWMSGMFRLYNRFYYHIFANPWSIVGFFGILLQIVLGGIQVWFSVKSTPRRS